MVGTHTWVFFAEDQAGNVSDSVVHFITIIDTTVSAVADSPTRPLSFSLWQNFPNPFNPSTEINYSIPMRAYVRLVVYNILGQPIATLVDEIQNAGYMSVRWDASGMASGVYMYQLTAGSFSHTKKLVLLR